MRLRQSQKISIDTASDPLSPIDDTKEPHEPAFSGIVPSQDNFDCLSETGLGEFDPSIRFAMTHDRSDGFCSGSVLVREEVGSPSGQSGRQVEQDQPP